MNRRLLLCSLITLLLCRVGSSYAVGPSPSTPKTATEHAPASLSPPLAPTLAAAPTPPVLVNPSATIALGEADLNRLQSELLSDEPSQRLRAANAIAAADPDSYPLLTTRLATEVSGQTLHIQRLIHAIWAQYPNPDYPRAPGKDPPMWFVRPEPPLPPGTPKNKRPKPHDPDAVDWLPALAQLDLATEPFLANQPLSELKKARADMLLRVALLRAITAAGKSGNREAVHPLFQFAFVRDGLFRDECGRSIRSMGSFAIPGLIRIYNNRTRANFKMRRYASYQLDRMDRLRPTKAISTAPDDVVRADIIHAYGEVLALDAVEAILEQINARSHRVRREARWAWLRYVDGPPPPQAPKRKRKLPGGKEESEEKEDYLNYREMATLALQRTHRELFESEPDPKRTAKELTEQLFQYYDRQNEQEFAQLFASAKEHEKRGELAKAVDEFGWILANQPDHPRRAEMANAFRRHGELLLAQAGSSLSTEAAAEKSARAVGWLRQSLTLQPDMPDAAQVRARIHLIDGLSAQRSGADGRSDLELALQADPHLVEAQQALHSLATKPSHRRSAWWIFVFVGVFLMALSYFLWKRLPRL